MLPRAEIATRKFSRNCPGCCGRRISAERGLLQVPIDLSKAKPTTEYPVFSRSQNQGPKKFRGHENWENIFQVGFSNVNSENLTEYQTPNCRGSGPEEDIKRGIMALETSGSLGEIAESGILVLQDQYKVACAEASASIKYLRNLWMVTDGNYLRKAIVVNRMICFYLIILGIYIAETCFWVNQKLIEGLRNVLLRPKNNADMLKGLGAILGFLFFLYLIGAPGSSTPEVCNIGN